MNSGRPSFLVGSQDIEPHERIMSNTYWWGVGGGVCVCVCGVCVWCVCVCVVCVVCVCVCGVCVCGMCVWCVRVVCACGVCV